MIVKRVLAALMALGLLLSPGMTADAVRVTDAMMDEWHAQMAFFSDEIGSRHISEDGLHIAYDSLLKQFEQMGCSYENGTLYETMCTADVYDVSTAIGIKPAVHADAPIVIVCAHYDSIGPGARDNASGLAAMLVLMRRLMAMPAYDDTELRFIAFGAEEAWHLGSMGYVEELVEDGEAERVLAVFNIDVLAVDKDAQDVAFSVDSMGMRTPDGYVEGTEQQPAYNKAVRALRSAMQGMDAFGPEDEGVRWCVPRHLGMSDHESFHLSGIDAVNVCFRGNVQEGGSWPAVMHTEDDVIGDFDIERTR